MRIWPQIILYSADEAARLAAMHKQGLIPLESLAVLFVLGRSALLRPAAPRDLLPYLAPDMPRFESWSACAFGRREAACVTAAALLGGHARVGFENNLLLPDGTRAASNAELDRPAGARRLTSAPVAGAPARRFESLNGGARAWAPFPALIQSFQSLAAPFRHFRSNGLGRRLSRRVAT
jgi:uncharacterized protein (DUF849 family)